MNKTLEALWYGNIFPNEEAGKNNSEIKNLFQLIARNRDELSLSLTEKQKEILEKYDDCNNELTALYNKEAFIEGFGLGACIAFEALFHTKGKYGY